MSAANSVDKISVIVVTYNVARFITFCIDSLKRSTVPAQIEIIIVDNHSSDGTVDLLNQVYADITIIKNDENLGFSKACNQGADIAAGSYLLFLNPDCIVGESAIRALLECVRNDSIGMAGPLLVDGSGHVLPESARELPTNRNAVAKLFHLPFQNKYPYYKTINAVTPTLSPVLTGACVLIASGLFEKVGGFDERFFMYGDDIDLSVRIINSGYDNMCVPAAKVIHFKGESTDKTKLKNNDNFYNAIKLYVAKHNPTTSGNYKKRGVAILSSVLPVMRYLRAGVNRMLAAILDFLIIFLLLWGVQFIWSYHKVGDLYYYGVTKYLWRYVFYAFVYITTLYLQGAYFDQRRRAKVFFKAGVFSGLFLMAIYSLLPLELRFSRGIILLATVLVPIALSIRYFLSRKRTPATDLLVTDCTEVEQDKLLNQLGRSKVSAFNFTEALAYEKPANFIFDFVRLPIDDIIKLMMSNASKCKFEFWDNDRQLTFSSWSSTQMGAGANAQSYYHLSQKSYLLHKRMVDIIVVLLLLAPIVLAKLVLFKRDFGWIRDVLRGRRTTVGYDTDFMTYDGLPVIGESILKCYDDRGSEAEKKEEAVAYASKYTIFDDILIITTNLTQLIKVLMS